MAEYFHEFTFNSLYFHPNVQRSTNLGQISIVTSPNLAISPILDRNVHLLRLKI